MYMAMFIYNSGFVHAGVSVTASASKTVPYVRNKYQANHRTE